MVINLRRMKKLIVVWFVLLSSSYAAFGEVVFRDDFDTNLDAWTLLNTPSTGGTVNVGLSGGKLIVSMTNNARWRGQGIQSAEQYTLPGEGELVVDFYGINEGTYHSYPFEAVCAYPNAGGCFNGWNTNWIAFKGWDAYFGDWVQTSLGGYTDLAGANATTLKHTIVAIDANDINIYIADDYYENLSNPAALYTTATSNIFTSEQLANGLYVCVTAARYTEWYTGTCTESFDGVQVSRIGHIPVDCNEAIQMGYGISGDIDHDCKVDLADLGKMVQVWLICEDSNDILCDGL